MPRPHRPGNQHAPGIRQGRVDFIVHGPTYYFLARLYVIRANCVPVVVLNAVGRFAPERS
jgi:hypothetical protein